MRRHKTSKQATLSKTHNLIEYHTYCALKRCFIIGRHGERALRVRLMTGIGQVQQEEEKALGASTSLVQYM